eukprot:s7591_g1.t2
MLSLAVLVTCIFKCQAIGDYGTADVYDLLIQKQDGVIGVESESSADVGILPLRSRGSWNVASCSLSLPPLIEVVQPDFAKEGGSKLSCQLKMSKSWSTAATFLWLCHARKQPTKKHVSERWWNMM